MRIVIFVVVMMAGCTGVVSGGGDASVATDAAGPCEVGDPPLRTCLPLQTVCRTRDDGAEGCSDGWESRGNDDEHIVSFNKNIGSILDAGHACQSAAFYVYRPIQSDLPAALDFDSIGGSMVVDNCVFTEWRLVDGTMFRFDDEAEFDFTAKPVYVTPGSFDCVTGEYNGNRCVGMVEALSYRFRGHVARR